jgi:hypothetical protein
MARPSGRMGRLRAMPVLRRALCALALLAAGVTAPAAAQDPTVPPDLNPCNDPALDLKCPNLRMAPPSNLHVQHVGGRVRLLATNRIVNVGEGPLELRGDRTVRPRFGQAYQVIYKRHGGVAYFPYAGWIYWKAIPGQGHYWKYYRAARFELWTLNPDGTRAQMVRTGPKLSYCFRDLRRVRNWARTPRGRVYPGCSQDFGRRHLLLGVSPGWADIYPSTYHENWISITGLRGCFAFVHRADPTGEIIEQSENDNLAQRIIRLPPRGGSVAPTGCPQPQPQPQQG